jgi:hypothetical protein
MTQQQLAARLAELGFHIGPVVIANIEAAGRKDSTARNRTRAANASIVDVLAFAAALDVPPPLLFIPLGDAELVQLGNMRVDPHLLLDWVAGDERLFPWRDSDDPNHLGGGNVGSLEKWWSNSQPIKLARELRRLLDRAHTADAAIDMSRRADVDDPAVRRALESLDAALRDLDRHQRYMKDAGMAVADVPDVWALRMMQLRAEDGR